MSTTYPDLLSNFPDSIDTLTRMSDLTYDDISLVTQYYKYYNAGNISEAQTLLNANPNLKTKIFNAEKFNLLADGNIAVQRFFVEKLQNYLNEQLTYINEYDPNITYKKTNIVSFNGEGFLCRVDGTKGISPTKGTVTANWAIIAKQGIQGIQGVSGTGLSPRGAWSNSTSYFVNDCVVYNNTLWQAIADNTNSIPSVDNATWVRLLTFTDLAIVSATQPSSQNTGGLWFKVI